MTTPRKCHGPTLYRIRLKGELDDKWSDWLEQMAISFDGGDTILTGHIADQSALYGLLIRIRDLNLSLLSVERMEPIPKDQQQTQ